MPSDPVIYAGVDLSAGRRPLTFAALDEDLNIRLLETWDSSQALVCLADHERSWLAINTPSAKHGQELLADLKEQLAQAGFHPFPQRSDPKQWLETNADECFRALSGHRLLPRRTLEGRLQRSAILFEQGLQIVDPVELFEEFTRFKLVQGILPLEKLHSPKELDALVAAYLAWVSVNRPGQIRRQGEFLLPAKE
jgi:hypothetical protein